MTEKNTGGSFSEIDVSKNLQPIKLSDKLGSVFDKARIDKSPVLAIVTGTKPDFYKQAPLVLEAGRENLPVFIIDTGQHFDEVLGFGIKEFNLQKFVG